ncbi:hypothetical protein llap_12753 [Limosa lapponica baueri]|uniref:Uncharacterized protein n=1 Tax=Limosa lapponica baueri TaxID=1758121 RepID=A0A2I0TT73_LIMLA|nr:hypothetical protein llap_12753 [Limosa lapponica baueri]
MSSPIPQIPPSHECAVGENWEHNLALSSELIELGQSERTNSYEQDYLLLVKISEDMPVLRVKCVETLFWHSTSSGSGKIETFATLSEVAPKALFIPQRTAQSVLKLLLQCILAIIQFQSGSTMECEGYVHYDKSRLDTCRPVEDKAVWRFFPAFFINDNADTNFIDKTQGVPFILGAPLKWSLQWEVDNDIH